MEERETVNRVADAAKLFARFCSRTDGWIISQPYISPEDGDPEVGPEDHADDRAAVLAAQLLAIASQSERQADALERIADSLAALVATATSPGKTQTAYELAAKYPGIFGAAPESVELMDGTKVTL